MNEEARDDVKRQLKTREGCERNMKGVTQGDITIWKARDKKHVDTYK